MEITPEMQAAIDAEVAKKLAEMKAKLTAAYEGRDNALADKQKSENLLTEARKQHDLDLLNARKDARTAGEKEVAALQDRLIALETHNETLSRNSILSNALSSYTFVSPKSAEIAKSLLEAQVQKDDKGNWVAKDGREVDVLVKSTLESADYSFLLKPPVSSGTGSRPASGKQESGDDNKPLRALSNEELFARYTKV